MIEAKTVNLFALEDCGFNLPPCQPTTHQRHSGRRPNSWQARGVRLRPHPRSNPQFWSREGGIQIPVLRDNCLKLWRRAGSCFIVVGRWWNWQPPDFQEIHVCHGGPSPPSASIQRPSKHTPRKRRKYPVNPVYQGVLNIFIKNQIC
jgi:hypothetical protein